MSLQFRNIPSKNNKKAKNLYKYFVALSSTVIFDKSVTFVFSQGCESTSFFFPWGWSANINKPGIGVQSHAQSLPVWRYRKLIHSRNLNIVSPYFSLYISHNLQILEIAIKTPAFPWMIISFCCSFSLRIRWNWKEKPFLCTVIKKP